MVSKLPDVKSKNNEEKKRLEDIKRLENTKNFSKVISI